MRSITMLLCGLFVSHGGQRQGLDHISAIYHYDPNTDKEERVR